MKRMTRNLLIVAAITATVGVTAQAHEGATGIVKQRMDAMSDMAKRAKAMTKRLRAGRGLAAIKGDAAMMQKMAREIAALFPAGSLSKHSEAREGIWQNWPDFTAKADALATEAAKLAAIAPDNVAALRQQMQAVVGACGACHEDYRVKKK
ncbi:MAG: cytochrome c [Pseudolabrys sp.]|nr:cytochrome c [Pseudolabrys sp.]